MAFVTDIFLDLNLSRVVLRYIRTLDLSRAGVDCRTLLNFEKCMSIHS